MTEQDERKDLDMLLTTKQAAEEIDRSATWLRSLIRQGRLKAQKHGRDWLIRRGDLDNIAPVRKGRPPKSCD